MPEPVYALIVSPHPDDAEFGCGGTVARWTAQGKRVVYLVCTDGEKGTADRTIGTAELGRSRRSEQRSAASVLGVGEVVFLGLPDQGLEDTPEFRRAVVREIRRFRPRIVITSDPYRRYLWHRDHRVTGQVVLDAVFPYARDHLAYPDLLAKGFEPHKVSEVWLWASEEPNHREDVSTTLDRKAAALQCHRSQLPGFSFDDPRGALETLARRAAEGTEFAVAEAFHRVVAPG